MKLTGHQQPDQPLGIAAIGLHAIGRPTRDQPRRAHHALDPRRLKASPSTNPVGPASHVARTGPANPAANAATSSLRPGKRRTRNSPESRSNTAATTPLTCTSKATQLFEPGWL